MAKISSSEEGWVRRETLVAGIQPISVGVERRVKSTMLASVERRVKSTVVVNVEGRVESTMAVGLTETVRSTVGGLESTEVVRPTVVVGTFGDDVGREVSPTDLLSMLKTSYFGKL